jgi:SAM-dependent methyltransferase
VDDDPAAFYVPLVRATFPTQLRVATRTALLLGLARTSRPLRVLDLGAGGAPWAIGFLTARPGSTAVVNDLAEVLDAVARPKVVEHGVAPRVEFRPGDFRTLELEPGAYDVVVLGHVCRTEGAEGAPRLIRRAFEALAPEGRLVLADYFVDNTRKFNPFGVLMGTTMMASTLHGNGFTHETYHRWIGEAGFRTIRLVEPIGFNQVYVATRPRSST